MAEQHDLSSDDSPHYNSAKSASTVSPHLPWMGEHIWTSDLTFSGLSLRSVEDHPEAAREMWYMRQNGVRGMCYKASQHIAFHITVCISICVLIGLLAQRADREVYSARFPDDSRIPTQLETLKGFIATITALFGLELAVRIVGYPADPWMPWLDVWICFDSILISAGAVDVLLLDVGLSNVLLLRICRLFRLLRECPALHLPRSLKLMVKAVQRVSNHALIIIVVLVLFMSSVSIALASTLGTISLHEPEEAELLRVQRMFSTVKDGILALALLLHGSKSWGQDVVGPYVDSGRRATQAVGYFMLGVLTLCIMFLFNMFKAIIVSDFLETREEETHSISTGQASMEKLRAVLAKFSTHTWEPGEPQHVTWHKVSTAVDKHPSILRELGITRERLEDVFISTVEVADRHAGEVSLDKFLMEVLKVTRSTTFTARLDIQSIDMRQKLMSHRLKSFKADVANDVLRVSREIDGVLSERKTRDGTDSHTTLPNITDRVEKFAWIANEVHVPDYGTPRRSRYSRKPEAQPASMLEERMSQLEERLREAERREADRQAAAARAGGIALESLLHSEVLPWLQAALLRPRLGGAARQDWSPSVVSSQDEAETMSVPEAEMAVATLDSPPAEPEGVGAQAVKPPHPRSLLTAAALRPISADWNRRPKPPHSPCGPQ